MRWSDGHPFTADDIIFFTDDLLPNTQFYAAPPPQYVINGKLMRGEKVDDYTVRLIFAGPYLTFPGTAGRAAGTAPGAVCQAFLQPVHAEIQSEYRQAAGRDEAAELGGAVPPALRRYRNPGALGQSRRARCWIPGWSSAVHGRRDRGRARRATRISGRSIPRATSFPYLDALSFKVISDIQSIVLAAVGGQMDLELRHVALINNKPVLAQHAKSRPLHAHRAGLRPMSPRPRCSSIRPIRTRALRALLTNHEFRRALSHRDRPRRDQSRSCFWDKAQPWQTSPLQQDPFL